MDAQDALVMRTLPTGPVIHTGRMRHMKRGVSLPKPSVSPGIFNATLRFISMK